MEQETTQQKYERLLATHNEYMLEFSKGGNDGCLLAASAQMLVAASLAHRAEQRAAKNG